jgi:hypothetical protein
VDLPLEATTDIGPRVLIHVGLNDGRLFPAVPHDEEEGAAAGGEEGEKGGLRSQFGGQAGQVGPVQRLAPAQGHVVGGFEAGLRHLLPKWLEFLAVVLAPLEALRAPSLLLRRDRTAVHLQFRRVQGSQRLQQLPFADGLLCGNGQRGRQVTAAEEFGEQTGLAPFGDFHRPAAGGRCS